MNHTTPARPSTPALLRRLIGFLLALAVPFPTVAQLDVRPIADLRPGPEGSYPSNFTKFGSALFFSAYTTDIGRELWRYDGATVSLVSNINDTVRDVGFGVFVGNDSSPEGMTEFASSLYFSAFDPRRGGELWRFDGLAASRVADINPDANDTIKFDPASSWPRQLTPSNNELLFSANGGGAVPNYELWRYNGSTATLAGNIHGDTGSDHSSYPHGLTAFNGILCFMADDGIHGYELWKYNGTAASLLADVNPGNADSSSFPKYFTVYNGALYFQAFNSASGFELWRTEGTTASLVTNLAAGAASSFPEHLTVFNNALYFSANGGTSGFELWKYDDAGARLAADINPSGDAFPRNLTVFQNKLCFTATDGIHGWELWSHDGATTSLVKDLNPSGDSFPEQLTVLNGALYFVATTPATGYELWRYDGTNITLAADLNPGAGSSFPQNLAVFNHALCFSATDNGASNWEPWTLTENPPGNRLDVSPAADVSVVGIIGGPFVPAAVSYTVTNSSGAALDWIASAPESWVTLAPAIGTLAPYSSTSVTASFNPQTSALPVGSNLVLITFSTSPGDGAVITRQLALSIHPLPAWLGEVHTTDTGFLATLRGVPEWDFFIEASTNLQTWTRVSTNQADPSGILRFIDDRANPSTQRFYRAIVVP